MKKKTIHLLSKSLLTKLALVVALISGNVSLAVADELKVTSTTSKTYTSNTPLAGNLLGTTLTKTEFIIPASKIADMAGKDITSMALTVAAPATTGWGDAEFQVFLKEVDQTMYGQAPFSLIGSEGATVVYEGGLDATKSSIDIDFTTNFKYSNQGKNLLVGIYCTKVGTAASITFKLIRENTSDYTYYSGYTNTESGGLTRTNWYPETTFSYQAADLSTPVLSVSPASLDFGSLRANGKQTVTVKNKGVGTMDVNIAFKSSTTDFTLSKTSLTGIGANESKTFDVNFLYNSSDLGLKNATITVTPTYNNADAIDIALTATAADPNVWEDFAGGIPTTWYNEGQWYLSGGKATIGFNGNYLRTPRLLATKDQQISFDVETTSTLNAQYSTDCINWKTISAYTESGNKTFAAPADGYYWLRFSGKGSIDNFAGWTLSVGTTPDIAIISKSMLSSGTVYGTYNATVKLTERNSVDETINLELYFGEVKVAEKTNYEFGGNSDESFTLSYTPQATWSGQVYVKITGNHIVPLETEKVTVAIGEPSYVLDEDVDVSSSKPTCSSAVIKLKYTPKVGWNTIVMPFKLTDTHMKTIFGDDYVAHALTSYENGTLTFTKYDDLSLSAPYLVYAPNAVAHPEGVYLQNVSVNITNWTSSYLSQQKGDACFKGTFAPMPAGSLTGKYGVTNGGGIAKAGDGASMKGYRAYLELPAGASARILVIDDEGEATDLGFVKLIDQEAKAVYNLSGQRVEKGRKGLYIVNGKKVVVK